MYSMCIWKYCRDNHELMWKQKACDFLPVLVLMDFLGINDHWREGGEGEREREREGGRERGHY